MSGTRKGGLIAYKRNTANDPDHYKKIGAIGGRKSRGGGFAHGEAGRKAAVRYGAVGGSRSKRGYRITGYDKDDNPIYAKIS